MLRSGSGLADAVVAYLQEVTGLPVRRDHFREYPGRYVLIGGTASHLALREQGFDFRATKDLDIILCIEALNERFLAAF